MKKFIITCSLVVLFFGLVNAQYDYTGMFSEEYQRVEKGGKWGYVDETGNNVIPLKYEDAKDFSEGMAAVKINGKYGYINKENKLVIPAKYDEAGNFKDGTAIVITEGMKSNIYFETQKYEIIPLED